MPSLACVENDVSLAERWEELRSLPLPDRLVLVRRLAERVHQFHERGAIHGRIGPESIRLDEKFRPQLCDPPPLRRFGRGETDPEACPPELSAAATIELPSDLAAAARLLEKAGYAVDPRRIDVYQLGALLCRLVTGHGLRDYMLSPTVKNLVPPPARQVLARAVGFDAEDCYRDCAGLIRGLDEALLAAEPAPAAPAAADTRPLASAGAADAGTVPAGGREVVQTVAARSDGGLPFRRLGHFEVLERIGGGGMGEVYKGYDESLGRVVALKVLPPDLARSPELIERFRSEAAAAARLDHPNVLSVYFVGEEEGRHFFAMPYVEGRSLAAWLESAAPPTRDEALDVSEQCLAGLEATRSQGLVHRDVKPGNILVERVTGRAVLIDFGLVRWLDRATGLTAPGTLLGTADYIAPEQARGERVDHRADVYAMGVLLYRLLSGRLPFSGETAAAVMYQHAHEPPPALAQVAPDVPPRLARIVERMLEKDPRRRYQTAGEVLHDLREFRRGIAAPTTSTVATRKRVGNFSRFFAPVQKPRWTVLGSALAAVALLAAWALWPRLRTALTLEDARPAPRTLAPDELLPKSVWVDALRTVDPAWDAVSGDWRREGTDVTTGPEPYSRLLLPVELAGGYDLTAEFTRVDGDGMAALVFPVGSRTCMLQFGAWSVHGLERIDGLLLGDSFNPTARRPGLLINGQRYTVTLGVRMDGDGVKIEAALDGQPTVSWSGKLSSLDVLEVWSLPRPRRPALAAHGAVVTFHAAAVRAVSGIARTAPAFQPPAVHLKDGGWIDLLAGADVERDTLRGRWLASDDGLSVALSAREERFVRLMFNRPVERNYDLVAEFTRTSGNDSVTISLPVGTRQCTLHFSANAGSVGGLERVNEENILADHNPAVRRPSGLMNGRRYQTLVQVRTVGDDATVEVWLDGEPFIRWAGRQASLSLDTNWMLPERPRVAIGCNQGNVTFHVVRVREASDNP